MQVLPLIVAACAVLSHLGFVCSYVQNTHIQDLHNLLVLYVKLFVHFRLRKESILALFAANFLSYILQHPSMPASKPAHYWRCPGRQ